MDLDYISQTCLQFDPIILLKAKRLRLFKDQPQTFDIFKRSFKYFKILFKILKQVLDCLLPFINLLLVHEWIHKDTVHTIQALIRQRSRREKIKYSKSLFTSSFALCKARMNVFSDEIQILVSGCRNMKKLFFYFE